MALGTNNITMTGTYAELAGSSSPVPAISTPSKPWTIQNLVGVSGLNPYSFYAPGALSTDGNKDIVITPPTSVFKLGDYRSYNHSAAVPKAANNWTQNWLSGSSKTLTVASLPSEVNVKEADPNAAYMTYKFYLSTANRAAETSLHGSAVTNAANFTTLTAPALLPNHTRTEDEKIHSTHIDTSVALQTTGLSTPNDYVYMDTYFSNISGTRLLNLGSVSGGYTTITTHQQQDPEILVSGTIASPPSGYTVIYPVISASSARCNDDAPIPYANGNIGEPEIDFYFGFHGIYGSATRSVLATSVTIRITYDGTTKDVVLGTVSNIIKSSVSTTLPGSHNWEYDKDATITVVAATFASTPSYSTC